MRQCPRHIAKELSDYDPRLSLRWDPRTHLWYFYQGELRLFSYEHDDGIPARELVLSEIMHIVRRSDNWANYDRRRSEIATARARRMAGDRRDNERDFGDATKESRGFADFFRRGGPKPFVSPC